MSLEKRIGPTAAAMLLNSYDAQAALGRPVDADAYNHAQSILAATRTSCLPNRYAGKHEVVSEESAFWTGVITAARQRLPNFGRPAPATD